MLIDKAMIERAEKNTRQDGIVWRGEKPGIYMTRYDAVIGNLVDYVLEPKNFYSEAYALWVCAKVKVEYAGIKAGWEQ